MHRIVVPEHDLRLLCTPFHLSIAAHLWIAINLPNPDDGWFGLLQEQPIASHRPRCAHTGTEDGYLR